MVWAGLVLPLWALAASVAVAALRIPSQGATPSNETYIYQRRGQRSEVSSFVNVTGQTGRHICLSGKQVPQLYLLGAQHAGTSSMAHDFFDTGIASAIGVKQKELHLFDHICGFEQGKLQASGKFSGRCHDSDAGKLKWLSFFGHCKEYGATLGDMTPINVRLPGLPAVLKQWYVGVHLPALVVTLREPIMRMQSGYYHDQGFHFGPSFASFNDYLHLVLKEGERKLAEGGSDSLSRDYDLDQFYRSMYSRNLEPWFAMFPAGRFAIIAMRRYFESLHQRQNILEEIYGHFHIAASNPRTHIQDTHYHHTEHPAPQDEIAEEVFDRLNDKFFFPDARNLSAMLSKGMKKGLLLAGYDGSASDIGILAFLHSNW